MIDHLKRTQEGVRSDSNGVLSFHEDVQFCFQFSCAVPLVCVSLNKKCWGNDDLITIYTARITPLFFSACLICLLQIFGP